MSFINIGPAPADETPLQLGAVSLSEMRKECKRFAGLLSKIYPKGRFRVMHFNHDSGTYCEVVAYTTTPDEAEAAFEAESGAPSTWADCEAEAAAAGN